MSAGSDTLANELEESLVGDKDFEIEGVDLSDSKFNIPSTGSNPLYTLIAKLGNSDLTGGPGGMGTFDKLMESVKDYLKEEYESNRLSGADYVKAVVDLVSAAMGNSVQYLLGKDQAYWNAVTAQIQARRAEVEIVTARLQLETAKIQYQAVRIEAANQQANYALTKSKLANEDAQYALNQYQLTEMLPAQKALLTEQLSLAQAQKALIIEQKETARAQTLDTRTDGSPITGSVGKQKELYTQQIDSYVKDAALKGIKVFTDAFTVMKTIDEGLTPPTNFNVASLDDILDKLKIDLDLV